MDVNDYWQDNKRFVTSVAAGALVFLIAYLVLSSNYQGDIQAKNRERQGYQSQLRSALFTSSDLSTARAENEALREVVARLEERAGFRARPRFRLQSGAGSANSQYLRALTEVREELLPRANRANLKIKDPGLGMPAFSPTRDDEIERYLEALDLIDTVLNMAIQAGVKRVDGIDIKLDPGLHTRTGVGPIERTRVKFQIEGDALPITRLVAMTQRPVDGRVLVVDELEMVSTRRKPGEARLDLTLSAARLSAPVGEEEGS